MERKNPFLLIDPAPLPHSSDKPLEVCLIRGEAIESRHRVHVLACDVKGDIKYQWGNPQLAFFPRSAIKLMQATSWVSAGREKRWELGPEELALACSSHCGEDFHVAKVSAWLAKLGLSEANLECGVHAPYDWESTKALLRAGQEPSQLHNNCSGKHAGFLTECRSMNWDVQGYTKYDHPVQQRVRESLSHFYDVDLSAAAWGIDGCGIPTYSVSLKSMAGSMAKAANPSGLNPLVREAVQVLNRAISANPKFVGGTTSFSSQIVVHTEGRVFAKVGAEGVYGAWIPKLGLGIAMKCEDGASRATEVAMAAVLRELGHPLGFFSPLVKRWTGEVVGQLICA